MQGLPHQYAVAAAANVEGNVALTSSGLSPIDSAAPAEFGGPGDRWSPETLLVAAVADCFVFTFRAIAGASSIEWLALRCRAEGKLDRIDRTTRFVEMIIQAQLEVAEGVDPSRAERLLEKAEQGCLITNSLVCPVRLNARVDIAPVD